MIKKCILILFICTISFISFSQGIIVGDSTSAGVYFKRVDTTFNWSYGPNGFYSIDMDFDNVKDFIVISDTFTYQNINPSQPPYGYHNRIRAYSTTNFTVTSPAYASASPYVKIYSYGQSINSAQNWTITTSSPLYNQAISWHLLYMMNHSWGGTMGNDIYIGFRKLLSNDTIYGWMRLDNSIYYSVTIKSYAFTIKTTDIKEKELNQDTFSCFPNPTSNHIDIVLKHQTFTANNIILKDVFGREVLNEDVCFTNNKYCLNTEYLPNGIYFLFLNNNLGIRKIVKQ